MNIVHISKSDLSGGAAIAATRICSAQQNRPDINSKLLVQNKKSNNIFVELENRNKASALISGFNEMMDELSIRLFTKQERGRFTFPYFGEDISEHPLIQKSDLINLHWVNGGFMSLGSIEKLSKLKKTIIWTLHDMWAFTGGCHYSSDCDNYLTFCHSCPCLFFRSENDFSKRIFETKKELFNKINLTIVTCSNWLADSASGSSLVKNKNIFVIPNPLDTEIFKPYNKQLLREKFSLPIDKKLILIGAMNLKDKRKGFHYLIEALSKIEIENTELNKKIELVVFGKLGEESLNKVPFKVHQLGRIKSDEEIVIAYNLADIYVAPSLQDNLPNTVMEAMSCGIPVVAFNVGGIPDMVNHMQNGILAKAKSSEELAEGVTLLLSDEDMYEKFSLAAREKVVNNFDQKIIANKYLDLYKSLFRSTN